jgi:pyruvate dehydrogenase E1 component alpha subunit
MSDPGSTYRTRNEIAGIRQVKTEMISPLQNYVTLRFDIQKFFCVLLKQERDPIERVRKLILAHDFATPQELKVLLA